MAVHSGGHEAPGPGTASVVVASFTSRRDAERTVASLGHSFRHKARRGGASAVVVTRNPDGSFKLVQSRFLTATGVVAMAAFFMAEIVVGLLGIGAARKGVKASRQRAHERQSGVGRDAHQLAEVFDHLGPHAACVLFHCMDEATAQAVATRADERGVRSSHYARTEFVALLDRLGSEYDWIRPAVAEPAAKVKKHIKLRKHSKTQQG
jgi:uncharacterized membrane protein